MPCNICGEEYRGLAGDCACTMYGYSDEAEFRREASEYDVRAYERMHPPVPPPNIFVRDPVGSGASMALIAAAVVILLAVLMSGCAVG
jgi:hypothetical protein